MRNKKKTLELMDILSDRIWEDKDFILGVCVHLETDEHMQMMIDWLNKHQGEKIESDEVLLKTLEIRYNDHYEVDGLITRD